MRSRNLALGLAALLAAAGCAPHTAEQAGPSPSPSRAAAAPSPAASATQVPIRIETQGGNGQYVRIVETNHGRKIYTIRALSGNMQRTGTSAAVGDLEQPHITFVDKNGTTTIADAPKAHVAERNKTVVMTGGVHAHTSSGSVLACDTLTYNGETERFHGEGNVHLTAPNGLELAGQHLDGDVKLQDVTVTGGGALTEPVERDRILMRDLLKRYGRRTVVKGVSAEVHRGEVVGLLGPNGAGKTTTFYMVVGLIRPDGGTVILERDGAAREITGAPMHERARAGIGYLSQENSIFRKLSVGDNLRLIWEMNGVPYAERERRLPELLAEFGLVQFVDQRGDSLSGGERRRVEIARAIATEPAFLLLDEPFTGIDPIAVADIQAMIRQLRDRGLGILITDHQVRETLAIVDRAYILNDGRIEVSGTAQDVLDSPVARKFYLGESFRL